MPHCRREYDQALTGDIIISKLGKCQFKIVFDTISNVTLYQVYNRKNNKLNRCRNVVEVTDDQWAEIFNKNQPFYPTTVLVLDNILEKDPVFVIKKVYHNEGKMIWNVSTKEIKQRKELPIGPINNVRIAVDSVYSNEFY
jgi:hypothetical protein